NHHHDGLSLSLLYFNGCWLPERVCNEILNNSPILYHISLLIRSHSRWFVARTLLNPTRCLSAYSVSCPASFLRSLALSISHCECNLSPPPIYVYKIHLCCSCSCC